ncbi:MAG: hypothetical protein KDA37_14375 [Planctomycetales bacterium]|nr:hypothetical protein [Planctomycetales bacterium]
MNSERTLLSTAAALLAIAGSAAAQLPPLPPMTNGDGNPANNGMKHALVSFEGAGLAVHVAQPPASPVTMTSGVGRSYDAPFDLLEGRYFNSQHGWLPEGILVPPTGADVWIKRVSASAPTGASFRVYEGGMGNGMANWSVQEVYAADGDAWKWDREMQHDLFVADLPGRYSMTFEVYLGDATTGAPLSQYGSATTTLRFTTPVPEPTTSLLALATVAGLLGSRRGNRR